jgi:hypothetical protein
MAIGPEKREDGARPYGGAIAGPAAKSIFERTLGEYMGVPPRTPSKAPRAVALGAREGEE